MTYSLEFVESALKEWRKLSTDIRHQLKSKLSERLMHPHVPASRLHGLPDCYKIKLRASGFRLVYQVHDKALVVTVIAVGKGEEAALGNGANWLRARASVLPPPCLCRPASATTTYRPWRPSSRCADALLRGRCVRAVLHQQGRRQVVQAWPAPGAHSTPTKPPACTSQT